MERTALIDGYVKPLSFKWLGNGVTGVSIQKQKQNKKGIEKKKIRKGKYFSLREVLESI